LPVPLAPTLFQPRRPQGEPDVLNIVWNHRWEYDKGPSLLCAIVDALVARGLRFRLHLLGQRFRQAPAEFAALQSRLAHWYTLAGIAPGITGFIEDRDEYRELLARSDVVLSTALHDFQGLAVLEASALGCAPLAPQRLVYPEYLGPESLYAGTGTVDEQAASAAARLSDWAGRKRAGEALPRAMLEPFHPRTLCSRYEALIHSLFSQPAA